MGRVSLCYRPLERSRTQTEAAESRLAALRAEHEKTQHQHTTDLNREQQLRGTAERRVRDLEIQLSTTTSQAEQQQLFDQKLATQKLDSTQKQLETANKACDQLADDKALLKALLSEKEQKLAESLHLLETEKASLDDRKNALVEQITVNENLKKHLETLKTRCLAEREGFETKLGRLRATLTDQIEGLQKKLVAEKNTREREVADVRSKLLAEAASEKQRMKKALEAGFERDAAELKSRAEEERERKLGLLKNKSEEEKAVFRRKLKQLSERAEELEGRAVTAEKDLRKKERRLEELAKENAVRALGTEAFGGTVADHVDPRATTSVGTRQSPPGGGEIAQTPITRVGEDHGAGTGLAARLQDYYRTQQNHQAQPLVKIQTVVQETLSALDKAYWELLSGDGSVSRELLSGDGLPLKS